MNFFDSSAPMKLFSFLKRKKIAGFKVDRYNAFFIESKFQDIVPNYWLKLIQSARTDPYNPIYVPYYELDSWEATLQLRNTLDVEMRYGGFYYKQVFSYDKVSELLKVGYAVDGRSGGLVIGRSHDEGGIYFLIDFGYYYKLMGEMEGQEFLFNVAASILTRNNWEEWNNYDRDFYSPFVEYMPSPHLRTIDTKLPTGCSYGARFVLLEGRGEQAIINKYSTVKNLDVINKVNSSYYCEYDSNSFYETSEIRIIESESLKTISTHSLTWRG